MWPESDAIRLQKLADTINFYLEERKFYTSWKKLTATDKNRYPHVLRNSVPLHTVSKINKRLYVDIDGERTQISSGSVGLKSIETSFQAMELRKWWQEAASPSV